MAHSLAVSMPGRYLYVTGGVFVLLLICATKNTKRGCSHRKKNPTLLKGRFDDGLGSHKTTDVTIKK